MMSRAWQTFVGAGVRAVALLGWTLVVVSPVHAQDVAPEGPSGWLDKTAVAGRRFMVAAANPHAVDAGREMLARGGSAVDAAIAAQLVLGLVEPHPVGHRLRNPPYAATLKALAAGGTAAFYRGEIARERGTPVADLAPKLQALGHDVWVIEQNSGVHAIVRSRHAWVGGADPRREGIVRGD